MTFKLKEKNVLKQITDYLKIKKIYYTRNCFIPYTGIGVADLTLCYKGYYIAVEVKGHNGKPSKVQIEQAERVKESGGISILAYNLDDVIKILNYVDSNYKDLREKPIIELKQKNSEDEKI